MDYEVARWINESLRHHSLLALVVTDSANWGVVVFGVLAIGLWILSAPYGDDRYKRACACGLSAAAVGLLANQLIIAVWHRPRPFEAHRQIVPLLPATHDASFPSDHASAAFGIAFGVLFVVRRTGVASSCLCRLDRRVARPRGYALSNRCVCRRPHRPSQRLLHREAVPAAPGAFRSSRREADRPSARGARRCAIRRACRPSAARTRGGGRRTRRDAGGADRDRLAQPTA